MPNRDRAGGQHVNAGEPALARSSRFGAGRSQAKVAQNSRRTAAAPAGSWSIHQWPSPSRAAVLAPARAAALAAEAALRKGSSLGINTNPGAGMVFIPSEDPFLSA